MFILTIFSIIILTVITTTTNKPANATSIMYPYGSGLCDYLVPKNDDGSEGPIDLSNINSINITILV